ncbi:MULTISPECIES: hypothetical protein [Kitasatospora]|uniref:Uncharacterized protein n=1 Tax=Kitasatospora setae (strain ATCC 33774 / DSM 43861 / JCM 3304 / KCC A-0304 / NBRC 14216 / KM-6054) TaxID=452652 RepID=E4N7F9_KITSK|nr:MULTISPECIES: hypothetical protein [Kitasatospora]BAJ27140.1 hypothetical protein KSE_13100 [Kitasatospora setae KM-6054]
MANPPTLPGGLGKGPFDGLKPWQLVLTFLPLLLLAGGLIGGALGGGASAANLTLAKKPLPTPWKILAMIGTALAAAAAYFLIVGLISTDTA